MCVGGGGGTRLGRPNVFSHGSSHSKGVLVLLSPEVRIQIDKVKVDDGGRYIFLKGDILDFNIRECVLSDKG